MNRPPSCARRETALTGCRDTARRRPKIRSSFRSSPIAPGRSPAPALFIADGMHDYLDLLNERDGGIGGVKIAVEECETGYDTKKGLECYEQVKPKNPVMVNPWSTGITLPLIPKAAVDKIPVLSMAYGLSASAQGDNVSLDLQSAGHVLGRLLANPEIHRRAGRRRSTS